MQAAQRLKQWIKRGESPLARTLWRLAKGMRCAQVPVIPPLHAALLRLHLLLTGLGSNLLRALYWTPLFQSRLEASAPRLYLYGGMPLVTGPLTIRVGSDCRLSAATTLSGRTSGPSRPTLEIGNNVGIGWQTTIAVGCRVVLGDHVRIAGRAFLAGYPGHPLEAEARARGEPDRESQVGDIILEDHVWLATGVMVMAGVRIGRGTVVAAGSVVTRDLPPNVVAAGNPARVIRSLGREDAPAVAAISEEEPA
ncbi:acetyltransferase [Aeromonas diversa CDC 2478-85]|uniref:Acetyltransferase n=1 Tax=Aeromonas diversa CDC 2478-85 TaxID=1268237 RepID=N9V5Y4_9GAMM|nr:acyltransferase [Aeromonas diversa]ENY70687.1 acetyltransferase [Aeromonas diversa CDC 2478-85]